MYNFFKHYSLTGIFISKNISKNKLTKYGTRIIDLSAPDNCIWAKNTSPKNTISKIILHNTITTKDFIKMHPFCMMNLIK